MDIPTKNIRKIIVTQALPYANTPLHLGHILEAVQTDIWTRFQNLNGNECMFFCADDTHGTPVMLKAKEMDITPEKLISDMYEDHKQTYELYGINFTNFYTTHSDENRKHSEEIYLKAKKNKLISKEIVEQLFDKNEKMFLSDRFIKGSCPKCNAPDQHGDNCEKCGASYDVLEIKDPISTISGTTPIKKESEHIFFDLPKKIETLNQFLENANLQKPIKNKLKEWLGDDLKKWDISRDAPYFGFEIPGEDNKYFYVWVDAPIGYIASMDNWFKANKLNVNDIWSEKSEYEIYHFIGKDIVYFHALFWPATLMGSNFRTPNAIFAHGFLSVNGQKMSKSRGTFIQARTYLDSLNPECLRYYYAYKLSAKIDDIDLNLEDFKQRVNSDIVGKVVNIASRSASFVTKKFDKELSSQCIEQDLYDEFVAANSEIAQHYEARNFGHAMRSIMKLADKANQYIDDKKPWQLIKEEGREQEVHEITSLAINLFRVLMTYLKPVLPEMAKQSEAFLNIDSLNWDEVKTPLLSHQINKFKPLMTRIEDEQIEAMIESSKG